MKQYPTTTVTGIEQGEDEWEEETPFVIMILWLYAVALPTINLEVYEETQRVQGTTAFYFIHFYY